MKLQMLNYKVTLLIAFLVLLSSCSAKHNSDANKKKLVLDIIIQEKLQTPEEIYYEDVYSLVLKGSCTSCHNSSRKEAGVDVSTYKSTLGTNSKKSVTPFNPSRSTMYETMILTSGSRQMPPAGEQSLTKGQINLVYQWINNGAKKLGEQTSSRPKSLSEQLEPYFKNPETIDYDVVNEQVFKKNCLDCHSDSGSKSDQDGAILYGQDMNDYNALFTDNGIVPEKLTDYVVSVDGALQKKKGSRIYKSIALNQTMPPASDGYMPVNSLHVKLIRLWIQNCAIEDYEAIKDNDDLIEQDEDEPSSKVRNCPPATGD